MEIEKHISETAFLANESKARQVQVSKDVYAQLWTSKMTSELWQEFADASCPYDDIELSLRNRFFLDNLNEFISNNGPLCSFINIASGFTSYPFLLNTNCQIVEVDYPHVLSFKTRRLAQWQNEGVLPRRRVEYIATDLCDPDKLTVLNTQLLPYLQTNPSFVLMEGITYYLPLARLQEILTFLDAAQLSGSLIAAEYWRPDLPTYPAFQKLEDYFGTRFNYPPGTYTFLEDDFWHSIPGYQVVQTTSTTELEPNYFPDPKLNDREGALPGYYVILKKN